MLRRLSLLILCLLPGIAPCAGDEVVTAGIPKLAIVMEPAEWTSGECWLSASGGGKFLFSSRQYAPDKFSVEVEMQLAYKNGTAAAFLLNDTIFGLDGTAETPFFYERSGQPAQKFKSVVNLLPNQTFRFAVSGDQGKMQVKINNQQIAEVAYPTNQPLVFGFRPQRNTIRIKNFIITGQNVSPTTSAQIELMSGIAMNTPACPTALAIDREHTVALRDFANLTPGQYPVTLSSLPPNNAPQHYTCTVTRDGKIILPSAMLTSVYNLCSSTYSARPFRLVLDDGSNNRQPAAVLVLFDPHCKSGFPQGKVVKRRDGRNELTVNQTPVGTLASRLNRAYGYQFTGRAVNDFSAAGINGNIIIVNPYQFQAPGRNFDLDNFLQDLYTCIIRTMAANPDATVQLFYQLQVPPDWGTRHPDELIVLDNKADQLLGAPQNRRQPSYASEIWRQEVGQRMQLVIRTLAASPFADRITSLRLLYANCGEWNHWGYNDKAFVDFSPPMQRAFGQWLQQKYGNISALQQAWGRPDATFKSPDLVPSRTARLSGGNVFRLGGPEVQSSIDYYEFFQQFAVQTINWFAGLAKEASQRRLLVGAYYGYYWGHYGASPYHFQDSGHYGLRYLLQSPDIDFIGGPYPYEHRPIREEVNGITGSINLHGKVWVSENDMRTHLSGADQKGYGTTADLTESLAIAQRDFLLNMSRGSSYYFFDFVKDWYRDPEFMAVVKKLRIIDEFLRPLPARNQPRVAIIFSEETIPYLSNQANVQAFKELRRDAQGNEFTMMGAPYHSYVESDLANIDFNRYDVVIFANSYYVGDETIRLTRERVAGNQRKLVFLYAPGLINRKHAIDPERARQFTGIGLKAEPDAVFERVTSAWNNDRIYMSGGKITFQTVIDDSNAQIIARYPDNAPAGARKDFPNYTSIVICHPGPNAAFMRSLLRYLGVHIYPAENSGFDHCYFANSLVGIYSRTGGEKSFVLPRKVEVIADLLSGEILGRNTNTFKFSLPARQPAARMFFTGSSSEFQNYHSDVRSEQPEH